MKPVRMLRIVLLCLCVPCVLASCAPAAQPSGPIVPTEHTKSAQEYMISAMDIGETYQDLGEGEGLDWKGNVDKVHLFSPDGLKSAYFRNIQDPDAGVQGLTVRHHVAVYESLEAAVAAFELAKEGTRDAWHGTTEPQEQDVPFGDSSWGMRLTWRWVTGAETALYGSIVRYQYLLAHFVLTAGDLSDEDIATYQQLVQDRLYEVGG